MGLRFRKSIKIAPGVRLNLGKKSVGISAGVKGARVSVNSSGRVTKTVGLPGTGLSYVKTSKIGGSGSGGSKTPSEPQASLPTPQPQPNKPKGGHGLLKLFGIILVALGLFLSIATIIGGLVFTAIGCAVLQLRARKIEAETGQPVTAPFKRLWQVVVCVAFVALAVVGVLTPDPVSKISLNGLVSTQLEVPEARTITFKYEPADASTSSITCESSNAAVATIEITSIEDGIVNCLVTPVAAGDTTISCKSGTATAPELVISVTDPVAEAAAKAAEEEAARKAAEEEAAAKAAEEEAARKAAEEEAARKAAEEAAAAEAAAQAAAEQQAAEQAAAAQTNSRMVYVTPTGKRYHYSASCAGKNATEATLDQATARGLTPCKKCAGG